MKLLFVLAPSDGSISVQDKNTVRDQGAANGYELILFEWQPRNMTLIEVPSADIWGDRFGVRVSAAFEVGPNLSPEDMWSLFRRFSADHHPRYYRCDTVSNIPYAFITARLAQLS